MKIRPEIEQKIADALDSLDGIKTAEPRPYFYTRLMGRLSRDERTIWENMGAFLSRPVIAVAGLILILIFNGFVLLRQDSSSPATANSTSEFVTDNEYVLASSSSYDFENLDPQ